MNLNMNRDEFAAKLKEMTCLADWHRRYYTRRARKYKRLDYWIRTSLGLIATFGAVLAGTVSFRIEGAILAGASAFALGTLLPNFKWDSIVSGLKDEQEEWARIFQGYEGLLNMSKILERDEMLAIEFQRVEELRKAAEINDRGLPEDESLLNKTESEVRKYYHLDD
jgi:hypothetical protein